jgi:exosortase F-associated protein
LINDFLLVGIIYSLFEHRKYVIFALWVQVAGLVFILFPYFLLKLVWGLGNGPLISFLHRLVVNPILLLLLIPSFYLLESKKN